MRNRTIKKIRIHPAIGVARLGNSPDKCFLGPEVPGIYPDATKYRDKEHCLKRQAARFRLFAYDEHDKVIGEITCDDQRVASIRWTVHLSNTKAAGPRFEGILHQNGRLRNERFSRESLVLDPGEGHIDAVRQQPRNDDDLFRLDAELARGPKVDLYCERFMNQDFPVKLKLGTLITDESGRLLVLGGHGQSASPTGIGINEAGGDFSFANHDGWYDDTSDGYVRATITWRSEFKHIPANADPSWVIVAPPKYAPSLESVITLYDVLYQVALDKLCGQPECEEFRKRVFESDHLKRLMTPKRIPSFTEDVYPVLRRAYDMRWVFARAEVGHEEEIDFARLSRKDAPQALRQHIFRQFRAPSHNPRVPGSGTGRMPYIWSDLFLMDDSADNPHPVNATLTRHQYEIIRSWACGDFDDDWTESGTPKEKMTPEGLDRAALDACVGAAFFPGIETSFHIRDKFAYVEPFRLDENQVKPGDVTRQMSVPWQSDFVDCNDGDLPLVWWPAQRPIDVRLENSDSKHAIVRWARNFQRSTTDLTPGEMVRDWWRLGRLRPTEKGVVEIDRVDHPNGEPRRKKARKKRR
jgi:L-Lysine epsilon oxidase N-terminal/L-lysine epsilon oxidase C-terminal domain